jgi:hypothetical protein
MLVGRKNRIGKLGNLATISRSISYLEYVYAQGKPCKYLVMLVYKISSSSLSALLGLDR